MVKVAVEMNQINKAQLNTEKEYFDLILTFVEYFPCVEQFERHFDIDEEIIISPDGEEEFGDIKIETTKYKPAKYPCIYLFCPIDFDGGRCGGGIGSWIDDFLYL